MNDILCNEIVCVLGLNLECFMGMFNPRLEHL